MKGIGQDHHAKMKIVVLKWWAIPLCNKDIIPDQLEKQFSVERFFCNSEKIIISILLVIVILPKLAKDF